MHQPLLPRNTDHRSGQQGTADSAHLQPRTMAGRQSDRGGTNLLADVARRLETPDSLDDAEAAAAQFDVSPFRLWLLFRSVDHDDDGCITKDELAKALTSASAFHQSAKDAPAVRPNAAGNDDDVNDDKDDADDVNLEEHRMSVQHIAALDELFDRVIGQDFDSKQSSDATEEAQNDAGDPHSAGISFPQFCRIMRYLWLQQLLYVADDNPDQYAFECLDYSSGYYRQTKVMGNVAAKRTRDFFIAPRHGLARMRWIDVPVRRHALSRLTILRLAVKYRFHPTSIEDAIDLDEQEPKVNSFEHALLDVGIFNCGTVAWLRDAGAGTDEATPSQRQRGNWALDTNRAAQHRLLRQTSSMSFHSYHKDAAKGHVGDSSIPAFVLEEGETRVRRNEERHYFITIPMFELSQRSQTSLQLYKEESGVLPSLELQPLVIEVKEARLGIFVASDPEADLVVTCSTKWRPTRIKPFEGDIGVKKFRVEDKKNSLERVKRLLRKRHSIQRHRNSNWLLHAIVDAVVDNLVPISEIYEAQLRRLSTSMLELQHRISQREVKDMIVLKRDLEWLQRQLRPFARVMRHLIDDDNIGTEVTHYLEDVEDHLLRTLEELSSYAEECTSLKDEYNAYLDRRMNVSKPKRIHLLLECYLSKLLLTVFLVPFRIFSMC